MDKLMKGIMKYRELIKDQMVQQFVQVKNNPMVSRSVIFNNFFNTFYSQKLYFLHVSTVE